MPSQRKVVSATFSIAVGTGEAVSVLMYPVGGTVQDSRRPSFWRNGAGAAHTSLFRTHFTGGLARRDLDVVTFNFLYYGTVPTVARPAGAPRGLLPSRH